MQFIFNLAKMRSFAEPNSKINRHISNKNFFHTGRTFTLIKRNVFRKNRVFVTDIKLLWIKVVQGADAGRKNGLLVVKLNSLIKVYT
jgi:hypothetical protein